jgi:hypothetical protein
MGDDTLDPEVKEALDDRIEWINTVIDLGTPPGWPMRSVGTNLAPILTPAR